MTSIDKTNEWVKWFGGIAISIVGFFLINYITIRSDIEVIKTEIKSINEMKKYAEEFLKAQFEINNDLELKDVKHDKDIENIKERLKDRENNWTRKFNEQMTIRGGEKKSDTVKPLNMTFKLWHQEEILSKLN